MDSKYTMMGSVSATKSSPYKNKPLTPHITFNKPITGTSLMKRPRLDGHIAELKNNQPGGSRGLVERKFHPDDRKRLPVFGVRDTLVEEIKKHPSVIIIGETGSGKTTQIPQYIHEMGLAGEGVIGVTQPRRVAAMTISARVAEETATELGALVGYTVRFEDVTSPGTRIKYLTDGMLLREAMLDKLLRSYSVLMLDEAHERTVNTDVLFGIVKQAQTTRANANLTPLKIVVMSATMDVDHFSNYFGSIPILYLEGRQYPVSVYHPTEPQEDYVFSSLVTLFQIHREAPPNHDILVFLTGQEEIDAMVNSIRTLAQELDGTFPQLKVCPLYSSLPTYKQLEVFRPTPRGMRKVILCTNIAETSITIPGIKYVVDSGMVKVRTHHPATGLDVLKVQRTSQAQAWQRTGRAGRESEGSCYRVATKREFESLRPNTVPEIQRCNLTSVVLQLMALNINTSTFDFMDKPPREAITGALEQLTHLGAMESAESLALTPLGRNMSRFPLDPRFSKILISAKDYGCVDEILSVVALLSSESIFYNPQKKREEAIAVRQKFCSSAGDHITLLNVFRAYNNIKEMKKQWCLENYLNQRNLQYASEVRAQLSQVCQRCGIVPSSCGSNTEQVRKCLVTGLFMNIAVLQRERHYTTVATRQPVSIHPSSVLFASYPHYVLFTEVVQTGRCYLRQLSLIEPEWLQEIVPAYIKQHHLSVHSNR